MSTGHLSLPVFSPSSHAHFAGPAADEEPEGAWPVDILGVPFDPVTVSQAAERIEAMVSEGGARQVVTANVDFLVQARRDAELRRILVGADLVLCDGMPLVWASRWLGNPLPGRAAGADLVPLLLRRAAARRWKIFLLGGAPEVAGEAVRRIAAQYPELPPIGHHSPPFGALEEMDDADIVARIRAARPDLLLVSFGCPKQEKWIARHLRELEVPVAIGVGATVDFLAGHVRRAPRWMQRSGVEWIFRLLQEPRRLAHRYLTDFRLFGPALFAQHRILPPSEAGARSAYAPIGERTGYGLKVRVCERLDRGTLRRESEFWHRALDQKGHCVADLGEVRAIDSTGLAFLAQWQKRLALRRRNLILFRPSAAVRAALVRFGLAELFIVTDGTAPARGGAPPGRPGTRP